MLSRLLTLPLLTLSLSAPACSPLDDFDSQSLNGDGGDGASTDDGGDRDGASDDGSDGPPDASIDDGGDDDGGDAQADAASTVDDCPNRSAPVGEPAGTIPPAEVFLGDLNVTTTAALQLVRTYRFVTGNLTIRIPSVTVISLPNLEAIGGTLRIDVVNVSLTDIDLPRLETVGASLNSGSTVAGRLSAPRLETVGDFIAALGDSLDVHCLAEVGGTARISLNESAELDLDKLRRVGRLEVQAGLVSEFEFPALTSGAIDIASTGVNSCVATALRAPNLVNPTSLRIWNCPQMASIDIAPSTAIEGIDLVDLAIPSLQEFAGVTQLEGIHLQSLSALTTLAGLEGVTDLGYLGIFSNPVLTDISQLEQVSVSDKFEIEGNAALRTIHLPQITAITADFDVNDNGALRTLSLPGLLDIGDDSEIRRNRRLPQCQGIAIRDQLIAAGEAIPVVVDENDPFGTCP